MFTPFAALSPEECWQTLTSELSHLNSLSKHLNCESKRAASTAHLNWCVCPSVVAGLCPLCLSGHEGVKHLSLKGFPVVLGSLLLVTSYLVLHDKLLLLLKLLSFYPLTSFQKYAKNKCKHFRCCCYYQCKSFKAFSWGKLAKPYSSVYLTVVLLGWVVVVIWLLCIPVQSMWKTFAWFMSALYQEELEFAFTL